MMASHETYDAWNRLVTVTKGYRDSGGTLQSGSVVSTMLYDGLGWRIMKTVSNSADWDCPYHYYYDGQSAVETRNGSDQVLKQQVWGITYVDELVQLAANSDPGEDSTCDAPYWALADANYNVAGLVDGDGLLAERYEYTPYGQRTVFFSPGTNDNGCYAPTLASRRHVVSTVAQPWGLCEFGHQGLMHDEETGNIYQRRRMWSLMLGRFSSPDPSGYPDGMSSYAGYHVLLGGTDPLGLSFQDGFWYTVAYAEGFALGIGQGVANVANGVQDGIIGSVNLPSAVGNAGFWVVGSPRRAPYIHSPDWSRDLIVSEHYHGVSKCVGGQGALTLITLGASQVGTAGQAANLGHVTTASRAAKIVSSETLLGKAGIYSVSRPSSSQVVNLMRTGVWGDASVRIPTSSAGLFHPIPAVGPISTWQRLSGGYVAGSATSINLATGTINLSRLSSVSRPFIIDITLHQGLQVGSQTASGIIDPFGQLLNLPAPNEALRGGFGGTLPFDVGAFRYEIWQTWIPCEKALKLSGP